MFIFCSIYVNINFDVSHNISNTSISSQNVDGNKHTNRINLYLLVL